MNYSFRYARQMQLKNFGVEAQERLNNSHVLVVGAGGLGCPLLINLAAAGVGIITIADGDVVALHNLHRQALYTEADINYPKASRAKFRLQQINSSIHINATDKNIVVQNSANLIEQCNLVIDCTDSISARYLLSDACRLLKKPLLYAAVAGMDGQVALFTYPEFKFGYRILFPSPPAQQIATCAVTGMLGSFTSIIGSVQAQLALLYLGINDRSQAGRLINFNGLTSETYITYLPENFTAANSPENLQEFYTWNYAGINCESNELSWEQMQRLEDDVLIVDVRMHDEQPKLTSKPYLAVTMPELDDFLNTTSAQKLFFICASGVRSAHALEEAEAMHKFEWLGHLKHGILAASDHLSDTSYA